MARFVALTAARTERALWVNLDRVLWLDRVRNRTWVYFEAAPDVRDVLEVRETPQAILALGGQ